MPRPRVITIDEIRPLIGNISRSNYYQVAFGGMSPGLMGYLATKGISSRFAYDDVGLMCYEASLPGAALAVTESSNFHGLTENFAHRRIYSSLSLEFYTDDEYKSRKFLEHWMEYCISGNGTLPSRYNQKNYAFRMQYPDDAVTGYKSESTKIYKFEKDFEQVMEYSFIGLFPLSLSSAAVRYGENNELTRLRCEFRYDRYIAGSTYSFDALLGKSNDNVSNAVDTARGVVDIARTIQGLTGTATDLFNTIVN